MAAVTVIIPTLADERRAETIWRAIESAGPRSGASTRIIVVVNGERYCERLLARLRATNQAECICISEGSMPRALLAGRRRVQSPYFAFLDDDDEFLEDGLAERMRWLEQGPTLGFVVSAGWLNTGEVDTPHGLLTSQAIESDPLGCLLRENWVATSGSGLYRSDVVTAEDFEQMPRYLEWTYLGFRLAARLPFRFLDRPTYRRFDLPGSVSKSSAYEAGMVEALTAILSLPLPPEVTRALRGKLSAAHHSLSVAKLDSGQRSEAWRQHLNSLALPGGMRYLSYTRRLLA